MIDLEHLFARDGLAREHTVNVYLIGSRAHGTAREGADYDVVVVMAPHRRRWRGMQWMIRDGWVMPDRARYAAARRDFVGCADHQVWIFDTPTFLAMRDAHVLLALECRSLPAANVWLAREDLRAGFVVDRAILGPSIRWTAERHWEKGARALASLPAGDDPRPARKFLVHAVRALRFGAQLAESGAIVDFGAANEARGRILEDPAVDWHALAGRVGPLYDASLAAFARACGGLDGDVRRDRPAAARS